MTLIHIATSLLLVHLDHIVLLHLQCLLSKLQDSAPKCLYLRSLVVVDPAAVKEEAKRGNRHPHLNEKAPHKPQSKATVELDTEAFPAPQNYPRQLYIHPLAVALLQFSHLCSLLHSEVDLVAVLAHHLKHNQLKKTPYKE